MSNRAKSPARSNEYSNSGNEEQQKKKKPLARDYVHAFLLRFNVPLFSFLACAALPFMPKHSSLTWFQCVYVYGWSLLPALSYVGEVGSKWITSPPQNNNNKAPEIKSITTILARDLVGVSYMFSAEFILWLCVSAPPDRYLPPWFLDTFLNVLPLHPYPLLTLGYGSSYVAHFVGLSFFGGLPRAFRRWYQGVCESAANLRELREREEAEDE